MARKRIARAGEVQDVVNQGMLRVGAALVGRGAIRSLKRRIQQLQQESRFWHEMLAMRANMSRKEPKAHLAPDPRRVAKACKDLRLRVEDLPLLEQLFVNIANTISGKKVEFSSPKKLLDFLARLAEPKRAAPRKFKPVFVRAFQEKAAARSSGQVITAEMLAQKLTPHKYQTNPESAIRAMQQGIRRVRLEHERYLRLGPTSPFLSAGEHQNRE